MTSLVNRRFKRLVGMLLLACMAFLIVGIPLPASKLKSTSEAFPCQNRPCGCNSAAQCWDKCCCHSDEEKIAWANENGVTPPLFLVARVEKARFFADQDSASESVVVRACCATKHVAKIDSAKPKTTGATQKPLSKQSNVHVVLLDSLHKCKGFELAIKLLSISMVDHRRPIFAAIEPLLLYCLVLGDEFTESLPASIEPPIP